MDDAELVEGLIRGDEKAQNYLLKWSAQLAELLLRRFEKLARGEIEEIVTEVLYEVILKPTVIDLSKGRVRAFVKTAALRQAFDRHKMRFQSWMPKPKGLGASDLIPERTFISLEQDLEDQGENLLPELVTRDNEPSLDKEPNVTLIYPPEVVQAAREIISNLKLKPQELEHIRMRLVDRLEPSEEIAPALGITAGNERVRWKRLKEKIEVEWMKYPALVKFSEQLDKGEILAKATTDPTKTL